MVSINLLCLWVIKMRDDLLGIMELIIFFLGPITESTPPSSFSSLLFWHFEVLTVFGCYFHLGPSWAFEMEWHF